MLDDISIYLLLKLALNSRPTAWSPIQQAAAPNQKWHLASTKERDLREITPTCLGWASEPTQLDLGNAVGEGLKTRARERVRDPT